MKSVFIKTYGCQMNVYDSARMAGALAPLGFEVANDVEAADLVLLNTCHIREKAAEKVFSELGKLQRIKRSRARGGRAMVIGVGGCVAQAEGVEIMRRAPYVDMVFGPQTTHRLPELVARAFRSPRGDDGEALLATAFEAKEKFDALPTGDQRAGGPTAFLTVQEGCDKFCTFCVVPYTRGPEFSRPPGDVVREAEALVARGVRDITLLGQNVNAYRHDETGFAELIARLARIEDLPRIRYTTSHPRDMSPALIAAHGHVEALMPYLHLPVQSGSDRILKAMNRGHGRDRYFDIVARLRAARSDIALSSDFIVGFPGETEDDFEATLDLVRRVGFAQAYSFKFSARPGTPAAELADQVPEPVKDARLAALQALLAEQQNAFNAASLGRKTEVLFERAGRDEGQYIGRSPHNQSVHTRGSESLIGVMRQVELIKVKSHSLEGRIVNATPASEVGV